MFDDIFELSDQEKIALKKSREIKIPFPISGYLVRASMVGPICFGMVYHHVKAGRAKKKFNDGSFIHTSCVVDCLEYDGCVVIFTLNSAYLCATTSYDKFFFMSEIKSLEKPTFH